MRRKILLRKPTLRKAKRAKPRFLEPCLMDLIQATTLGGIESVLEVRSIGSAGEASALRALGRGEAGGSWVSGQRMSRLRGLGLSAGVGCIDGRQGCEGV